MVIELVDDRPPLPEPLAYLWGWFNQHSYGLSSGGMGPSTVTWEGLAAWSALMKIEMEPWESFVMVRLGYLRALIQSEEKPKTNGNQNPHR